MSESEKFHRLAVEAGRIGTWDLNLQTEECLISPKMAELMGFSHDQTTVPVSRISVKSSLTMATYISKTSSGARLLTNWWRK